MIYDLWIDQETVLPQYMALKADINMAIPMPETNTPVKMNMQETVNYEIYGLGSPIVLPDVSQAKDMQDLLTEPMPTED
jgi:hypothetical protein